MKMDYFQAHITFTIDSNCVENWDEKRDDAIKKENDNVSWRVTPPMLK